MDNALENNPEVNASVDPIIDPQILDENVVQVENSASSESTSDDEDQINSNVTSNEPLSQDQVDPIVPSLSSDLRIIRAKSYDDLPDLFKQHENLFFKTALGFKSGDPIDVWFEVIVDPRIAELVNSINSARSLLTASGLNLRGL